MNRQRETKDFRVAVGPEPADRPIAPLRGDLLISPQLYYGKLCFVIKDPVTLRYFRLQPVEHFLITQLDNRRTARDLLGVLGQQFPESALGIQDVLRFVGMLHESHLLSGEGAAHAQWLSERATATRNRKLLELAQNFLFFKMPLFNPNRLLNFLDDTFGPIVFHPLTAIAAGALVLVALLQVLSSTDRLANLPYSLFSMQNLAVLYCVYIVTKVFHEFGHGWMCKHHGRGGQRGEGRREKGDDAATRRHGDAARNATGRMPVPRAGGEVSNMGVMLFVFTPAFYCDTSDAWMIPSRAARLWINSGGVVVELVLAAIAALVWVYTQQDTLISQIALNTMISCSVSTIVFNANPLLRYDGYYFLADYLEIPNLMSKGREFLTYFLQKRLLGLKPVEPADLHRLRPVLLYAVASSIYRWMVTFAIIMLLYVFFEKHGLAPIGVLLATTYILLTVLMPLFKALKFLWKQRWDLSKRLTYIGSASAATAAALVAIALLPWPHTIREPLVVLSEADEPIFVRTPGYVESVSADAGDHVTAGQVLVRLKDPTLQNLLDKATARRDEALIEMTNARAQSNPGAVAAGQTMVDAYNKQIDLLNQRIEDLTLRAPIDGVVIRQDPLKRIVGNYVPPGQKLCRVIRTDRLQARISLPQQKAADIQAGMAVRLRLWSQPNRVIDCTVSRVSSSVSDQLLHPALASTVAGDVQVTPDPKGNMKTAGKRSTVIIHLPAPSTDASIFVADGMTGRAEIITRRTTVIGHLWRSLLESTTPDWRL